MALRLARSESGDWFLIPWEIDPDKFRDDELEEKADYATYVSNPENVFIPDTFDDI